MSLVLYSNGNYKCSLTNLPHICDLLGDIPLLTFSSHGYRPAILVTTLCVCLSQHFLHFLKKMLQDTVRPTIGKYKRPPSCYLVEAKLFKTWLKVKGRIRQAVLLCRPSEVGDSASQERRGICIGNMSSFRCRTTIGIV